MPKPPTLSAQETEIVVLDTSLLALGERVMLQTAVAPLQSLDRSVTMNIRVLLDSASQRTFMTEQLARRLNLNSEGKELLTVCYKFGYLCGTVYREIEGWILYDNVCQCFKTDNRKR